MEMSRVLPPKLQPVLQQIRLLQVAGILSSDWIKLHGSHAMHGMYVTCCKPKFALGLYDAQHVRIL